MSQNQTSRRRFLQASVGLAAGAAGGAMFTADAVAAEPEVEKLTAYQVEAGNPHVWVRWGKTQVTSYRAHPTQKYPYFYPLTGPISGVSLTTETSLPWPHHRSLLFACDHVNGGNYWQGDMAKGQIISTGPSLKETTEHSTTIIDHCEWRTPGEPVVMTDDRQFVVTVPNAQLRLIDAQITLNAVTDITVTKTNHSLFAIRAASDIAPVGGGTLMNAHGDKGEKATFGKPAPWCTYFGQRKGLPAGIVEGIALMHHPGNPWPNCPWFTRDYGFISPTPFNFIAEPWQLPAGESVTVRYRVVMYAGTPNDAGLKKIYTEFAAS